MSTISSPPLVISSKIAKTDTSFLEALGSSSKSCLFFGSYNIFNHLNCFVSSHHLFNCILSFSRSKIILIPLLFQIFLLFFLVINFIKLFKWGIAGILISAGFAFLDLDSLVRGFWAVILWVCIFEEVICKWRWPLRQQASESRTIALDLGPTSISALTVLYIISSKPVALQSCYSILALIEGFRSFWK